MIGATRCQYRLTRSTSGRSSSRTASVVGVGGLAKSVRSSSMRPRRRKREPEADEAATSASSTARTHARTARRLAIRGMRSKDPRTIITTSESFRPYEKNLYREAASDAGGVRGGRPAKAREQAAEALVEADLGLPTEHLERARDGGLAHLRIIVREGLEHDLARRPGDADDGLRELEEGHLVRVPEVHGQVLLARGEQVKASDEVVGVAEGTRLRPVAEHRQRLAFERLADERRD